jgi:ribosomal protein S18 acetylase RimI-like enzyme
MKPYLVVSTAEFSDVLRLIQSAFAYMDSRIDPPSSMHRLTVEDLARSAEVWAIGHPPAACMVLTPKENSLYLGKLAVAGNQRGKGLARRLTDHACARARALGLPAVELQTRVELIENHKAFRALGFTETGRTAHPGHDRPTSVTFRKPVTEQP